MKSPTVVFIHGLLGDTREWIPIVSQLKGHRVHLLTLPGHNGNSKTIPTNFFFMNDWLTQTLVDAGIHQYWLVGYSLGGRLSAYHAFQSAPPNGLQGLILEGAHPGLIAEIDKASRWISDKRWADVFSKNTMEDALQQWYCQPVFSDLSTEQQASLLARRKHQQGNKIAQVLLALSLSKQPYFGVKMQEYRRPLYYICGEQDRRFQTIAQSLGLNLKRIPAAGHNAHIANPAAFATALLNALHCC